MVRAQDIKDAVRMPDVLRQYGYKPNRKGFIQCPFHTEKTASCGYFDEGRRWKCFGCGAGGDVISFVQRLYGLSFAQAVVRMAGDFGLADSGAEDAAQARARATAQRRRLAEEAEAAQTYRDEWERHMAHFRGCEAALAYDAPRTPDEPMTSAYADALHWMEWEWAWLCEHPWK